VGLPPLSREEGLEAIKQQHSAQRKRDQAVDIPDVVVDVVDDRSSLVCREHNTKTQNAVSAKRERERKRETV
jgi:hypothetical protein